MVRVFGWDCASQSYAPLGQDLFGGDEFDGFGQSVDLSSDGKTMAIGSNQPPPGKSGYVEVYSLSMSMMDVVNGTSPTPPTWEIVGSRMDKMENLVEDVGRQVKISDDGSIVMFSGSIVEESDGGWHEVASYIRVMELVNGEWKSKGNEIIGSIGYDDNGAEVHISQSGDGLTLGVTGSYSSFLAKLYTFDPAQQNWTEIIVPPIKSIAPTPDVDVDVDVDVEVDIELDEEDDDGDGYYYDYEWDYEYESYFSGSDLAISTNGNMVAIAGLQWNFEGYRAFARTLTRNETMGTFSLSTEFVEYKDEWSPSSLGMSADGSYVALGINTHFTNTVNQGAMFIVGPPKSSSSFWGYEFFFSITFFSVE
jgi:hypothetical protein